MIELDNVAFDALLADSAGVVMKELLRRGLQVEKTAKRLCPVDTGRLRSSITLHAAVDRDGPVVLVGTDVSYAIYVELGTHNMAAEPFLRPALGSASDGAIA